MYMDDMKLFAKNEKELVTLTQRVGIYSQYIGMEYGIAECAMQNLGAGNDKRWKE